MTNSFIRLVRLSEEHTVAFKEEMQEAFQHGFEAYNKDAEETDSAYLVVFRSYTGAFVNFYVDKASGTTRMEEYVPTLDVRNEAGTIDIFDYLEKEN
jgi:hypothetical protein